MFSGSARFISNYDLTRARMVSSFVFALVGDWMAIWLDEKLVCKLRDWLVALFSVRWWFGWLR